MEKQNFRNSLIINKASLAGEKLLERISCYILSATILMLLGLINVKGPLRGFPFPWLFNMKQIIMKDFVPSFIVLISVVVGADLLARLFVNLREPRLKVHTRPLETGKSYDDEIEISEKVSEPELSEYRADPADTEDTEENLTGIQKKNILEAQKKYRAHLPERIGPKSSKAKNGMPGSMTAAIIALTLIFSIFPFIVTFIASDDYTDDDIDGTDDYEDGSSEEAVDIEINELFDHLEAKDYDRFEGFATAEELDEIYKLIAWDEKEMSRESIYEHISEEDGFAVSKYLIEDYENEKRFLMAVKMKLEHSEEEGWSAETTGLALAPDPAANDDIEEYSESDLISYARDIISNSKTCGDAKLEGVSILVWDPDTDIFGREKTTET